MSYVPLLGPSVVNLANAMRRPSGDHAGPRSAPPAPLVNRVIPEPSGFITNKPSRYRLKTIELAAELGERIVNSALLPSRSAPDRAVSTNPLPLWSKLRSPNVATPFTA